MKESIGDPQFPVWLIADSEPEKWHHLLSSPLDPRHPARHSIWTPVLEYMQAVLYKNGERRFNTDSLYIRNAVKSSEDKPDDTKVNWSNELQDIVISSRNNLLHYKPKLVLTFGAFAFEFLRRTREEEPLYRYSYWGTRQLGEEFRKRIKQYNVADINVLLLLHVSISRGKFLESHRYFTGEQDNKEPNYFEYVGTELAKLFLEKLISEPIWIKRYN